MDMLCFVFLVIAGYLAISIVQKSMQTMYQTIPVSRGWFYMPFPIGACMSLFQIINVGYKRINAADDAAAEIASSEVQEGGNN
jgi:TRAP-type C4-dicarboxylate transport system permease small subunit